MKKQQTSRWRLSVLATLLIAVAIATFAYTQRYNVYDWYRLREYTPSAEVVTLASTTSMNDFGKRLFYVNYPNLSDRRTFSENCQNEGERTIVLGCYISGQGIYIYNVTDERLAGVREVTAAHEMLHAAYERLPSKERERIDALTKQAYSRVENQRLRDNVESYRKRDPSIVPNELHSIIGTEVGDIPKELEDYYKRYFDNRLAVVTFAERYEQAFIEREQKAEDLEKQISGVRLSIDDLEKRLASDRLQLERDRDNVNTNQQVEVFNARVSSYNNSLKYFNTLIDQHNSLVEQYQQIVLEENELIKALDSRPSAL